MVGASDDPTRIGGRPLSYMLQPEFAGVCFPVNPNRDQVQNVDAYPNISAIPGDIDYAIIAVPAKQVPDAVAEAAKKGAKVALVFSSGFAEMGGEGIDLQQKLLAVARQHGIRVVGPNCLGLFNSKAHFYATFTSSIDRALPRPGGVAIASQSGAYGSHIYMSCHQRGLGLGQWITTGNELDVEVAEVISLLAADPDVHTILAYVESVKDGPKMIAALEAARANRIPVVVTKVGTSDIGAAAAASHTASLAGEDKIYDAIFRQYGAFRVSSTEEMIDVAVAARPRIYPVGNNVGLVTISGGAGILMADAAKDAGLDVGPMPQDAQDEMKEVLSFAAPRNPVDVTAQFFNDLSLIPRFTRTMLDRGGYDGLVGFWTSVAGSPILGPRLLAYLKETMAAYPERLFLHVMLASAEMREAYESAGFPTFHDPSKAVQALAAMVWFGKSFAQSKEKVSTIMSSKRAISRKFDEQDAKQLLASAGIPMVADATASSVDAVREAMAAFDGPVAMKILSQDILHKSDVGGVMLHISGPDEAAKAYGQIIDNVRRHRPDLNVQSVLISPMAGPGVDMILGGKMDPIFGPIVMVGLGGIHAELFQDVAFRHAPIDADEATVMIDQLKARALLDGMRGEEACDIKQLADAIVAMGQFVAANADGLLSVEVNPIRVSARGCVGLDALIEMKEIGDE